MRLLEAPSLCHSYLYTVHIMHERHVNRLSPILTLKSRPWSWSQSKEHS